MEFTYTLEEIPEIAGAVVQEIDRKIVLFYGDMGVGKTTLIKKMAEVLGVKDMLSSPTFSIVNEYETSNGRLYHFDCYRIESEEEALHIGMEEYLDSGNWCFIEWPEKISDLLPEETIELYITKNKNQSRTITIHSQ